jgi:hypothetical protein
MAKVTTVSAEQASASPIIDISGFLIGGAAQKTIHRTRC